jgi:hypothetical protein
VLDDEKRQPFVEAPDVADPLDQDRVDSRGGLVEQNEPRAGSSASRQPRASAG